MDIDSVTIQAGTAARNEAKLRLLCMTYDKEDGLGLLDISDDVKQAMALSKGSQPEAFTNLMVARCNVLADSMDRINTTADWPDNYASTP